MKKVTISLILLFVVLNLPGHYIDYLKTNAKSYTLTGGLAFTAGLSDGLSQTLQFHFWEFEKKFPKANKQFWNPEISWKNKYKDVDNGNYDPAFFGSKTFLCWATDGYHMSRTITNTAILAACVMDFDKAKKWHWYIYDFIIFSLLKSAGFHLSYSIIFKT